jgi:hypothetical protein
MLMSLTPEEYNLLIISQPNSVEMLYVKNLFRSPDQRPRSQVLVARLIPKFIYEWRDDFQFSARILCIYSSVFLLLFFVIIWACVELIPGMNSIQNNLQEAVNAIVQTYFANDNGLQQLSFPLPNFVRPFLFAVAMTATIIVIQLLVLLVNIRRNLLQAFRGDDSELPRRQRSEYVSYATGNFHFAGYFIGYFIWGFIIIATFSTIVCLCIDAFIVYGSVRILEQILKAIIPSLLIVIFKVFLNKLLAQYVFLQHCGDVLALNNRRFLMIFIYFNFFLDAFIGFISSILRFVESIIGTILYMCRLDYSSMGRKLEVFDSGFNAYCGFIHTECTHRHPIMLVFVSHLFNQIKKQQHIMNKIDSNDLSTQEKYLIQQKKSLRYIRKWRLAVFLIQNPIIVFFRKTYLKQLRSENPRALSDGDNDNGYNIQRGMALYAHQIAAQQLHAVSEIDPTPIISERL